MSQISIIIPIYNQAKYINRCLKSVFNQTFKDFEVIVVDDGSTDNLNLALRPHLSRIKLFRQANQGAPAARNFGFNQSRGKYIIFCDADLVLKPDILEKMIGVLEKKPAFAYAYPSFCLGFKKFRPGLFDPKKLKEKPLIHTSALIRRECFPGFDPELKKFQDWDLWLTMLKNGHQGIWLKEILFKIKGRGTMSQWLPKFFYHLPWLKTVKKYKAAEKIIREKHQI